MKSEFTIFEIPVYYTNEDNHNKKWKNNKENFINHQLFTGATSIEAQDSFRRCYKYESSWKYHKIIGFIEIKYDNRSGDLKYYVYKTINKKKQYNRIFKLMFDEYDKPNLHDFVRDKANEKILSLINNKVDYIKKVIFNNKCYVDINAYNLISKYINFKNMINDLDNLNK